MARNSHNYSQDRDSQENYNVNDKYSITGESEFSRESTIPFDEDEVMSERHYTFDSLENVSRRHFRTRELPEAPVSKNFRGRGPKGYRRSDESIREDVSEALYRSTEVDASEIEVTVESGIVKLKGFTTNRYQKRMAEETIEHLSGVEDIYNDLRVRDNNANQTPGKYGLTNNITGLN
jgi:hypothetical protein